MAPTSPLMADLMLPELERQLAEDDTLWPNVKGYLLLQGNDIQPVITADQAKARAATRGKVRTVKIQIEDSDLLNFITGGLTGVKAYMVGRIKVRGDLVLAQRLEEVFEKAGGKDVKL
ncbi:hypothetical protein HPULCUR_004281 [Helicostylum pulchrum]|uniref:SCP2 domain-containing protein n=1 Tax=Helicostylum pulchrum TaxID=562976 RepID=A0ABP9XVS4_9FUNG